MARPGIRVSTLTDVLDPVATGSDPAPRTRRWARHILDNYYIGPARDPEVLEIWGYSDRFSYAPGETVAVHLSTTAERYDIEIGRDGAEYVPMRTWTGLRARWIRSGKAMTATS